MPQQDTSEIKEKILSVLRRRGPSLPVHIANEIKTSILFASAFLSELVAEKKIRMSYLRVGNSPLYFIPGQEYSLEKFSQYLQSKEKDAFSLLKEKKFLIDSRQEPAIQVALRVIKDFARPFKREDKIIWRYYKIPESEFKMKIPVIQIPSEEGDKQKEIDKELSIFDKKTEKKKVKKTPIKKKKSKKTAIQQKKNEKFFSKVKEFLTEKKIEILDIENFSKNDLVLRIMENREEKTLIAFNKKRITEADILKAYKRASELNLPYIILSLGEAPKKLGNLLKAIKNLDKIEKLE